MKKLIFGTLARLIPRRTLERWAKRLYARWPRRRARPIVPVLLVNVLPRSASANLGLNHLLRQAGYTTGDRLVVLLESDYQRVCDVAQSKLTNPMAQMVAYMMEASVLERLKSPGILSELDPTDLGPDHGA